MLIDTHCHLDKNDYDDIEKVIKNMNSNIMIASAVDLETSLNVINMKIYMVLLDFIQQNLIITI